MRQHQLARRMKLANKDWLDVPVIALLAANAVPLFGVLFVQNYLLKGEYAAAKPNDLMGSPYRRVVVMHVAILASGFFVMALGSPAVFLVVLVVLKTILDINLHNREHKKARTKTLPVQGAPLA